MSQRNETTVLVLAFLIALGIIGGVFWWLTERLNVDLGGVANNQLQPVTYVATFARVQNVPSGLFSYGGSTTWAPIRSEVDPVIQSVWPEFRLRYTNPTTGAPGSATGIRMLLNNQLAFAQSSRPLNDREYQQAQTRGFTLQEIPVAVDAIAIAVHPTLNVTGITVAQLKEIYTGRIANWNQLGGPNLTITPYSRRLEEGGTVEFFAENVLENEAFATSVQFIPTTTQALREVANNLGGIYYASASEVVPQCTVKPLPLGQTLNNLTPPYQVPFVPLSRCPQERNQLNTAAFQADEYPITRRLFVIIKQNEQIATQAGEAYANLLLTDQGQELIRQAGFVSIR
ncbi:PstS family phosphate ABC transporter substrate-binding protein [Gloeocapsa sp. BRSZ]